MVAEEAINEFQEDDIIEEEHQTDNNDIENDNNFASESEYLPTSESDASEQSSDDDEANLEDKEELNKNDNEEGTKKQKHYKDRPENYREKYGHNESSIPDPYDSSDEERLKWRNREEGKYDLPSELKPKKHLGINLNSQNREIMHSQLEKFVTTLKLKSYPVSRFHEMDDYIFLHKKFVQHGLNLTNKFTIN